MLVMRELEVLVMRELGVLVMSAASSIQELRESSALPTCSQQDQDSVQGVAGISHLFKSGLFQIPVPHNSKYSRMSVIRTQWDQRVSR